MLEKISSLIKAGKHYGIERFGILVGVLFFGLVAVTTVFAVQGQQRAEDEALRRTIYIGDATSQVSEVKMNVENVYRSRDNTHAMVLLSLDSESKISEISTEASSYKCVTMCVDKNGHVTSSASGPRTGAIYIFGNSGKIGIYISAPNTFARERTYIGLESSYLAKNSSDADQDRWIFEVNLGADGAIESDSLGDKSFDASKFFAETVLSDKEAKLKETLDGDLSQMHDLLSQIGEAQTRVKNYGVSMDGMIPAYMFGDTIEGNGDELTLKTESVAFGGFAFDWRSHSVTDSYMQAACGSSDLSDFLKYMKNGADATAVGEENDPYEVSKTALDNVTWVMKDGSPVGESGDGVSSSQSADISAAVDNMTGLWTQYMDLKHQYQTDDIYNLIDLEIQREAMGSTISINQEKDAFIAK